MSIAQTIIDSERDVIVHGRAGSGKSYIAKEIIKELERKQKNVLVMSFMGKAAQDIGGITVDTLLYQNKYHHIKTIERLTRFDAIIIDEISMLDSFRLTALYYIKDVAKSRRNRNIRMLFFGDVHQLPPVVDKDELERMRKDINNFTLTYDSFYFFNSMYFKRDFRKGKIDCYNLTTSYRQLPEEKQFLELLDKIALCQITQDDLDILNTRVVDASFIEKPEMTYLTTTTLAAKSKNIDYLKNNVESYKSVSPVIKDYEVSDEDKQLAISAKRKHALNRTTADIGIGVPIIFTVNGDHWRNGTQGVITAVKDDTITVKRKDGYTISVNKMTADIEIKVYNLTTKTTEEKVVAEVTGYPFCTGYAFTIHKMQGATCEGEVIVDTGSGGCFAFGQLYVSLSRVRRLQDLYLINPIKMTDIIPNEAVDRYWTKFLEMATNV